MWPTSRPNKLHRDDTHTEVRVAVVQHSRQAGAQAVPGLTAQHVRGRGTAQLLEGFPTHLTFMTITRQLDWAGGSPPTMHCTVSPHEAPSTSEDFAK